MDRDVFLSLLAMDSYNRGEDRNVFANGSAIDEDEENEKIGSATIIDVPLPAGSIGDGFYAIAYNWNGETIISYRGTNEPSPFLSAGDILTRLSLGAASSPPQKYCAAA